MDGGGGHRSNGSGECKTLYVGNLDNSVTEELILALFGNIPWWGEIKPNNLEKCRYLSDTMCMAVLTHFQQMSYDIFSLLYRSVIRCCILLLGTVYTGSELIEISEPINVMKIFLGSFCLYFLIGVSGDSDFFTDVTIGIRSTFQIPWTSLWSAQKIFQRPLKTTNKFQLKPRNLARMF